jgi:hypothetical protein
MELAGHARKAVRAAPAPIDPPAPIPAAWRELLGLYADPEFVLLVRLEWRDGKLTFVEAESPKWRPALTPSSQPDVFIVEPGVREAGEPCTFDRRADGRIRSVMLGSAVLRRLDPVE